jgi:hypothetical protein
MSERKVGGIIADEKTAEEQTKAAMEELMGISSETHKFIYEKMLVEKDGKLVEIEVPIDDIDLLDDMDDEDLTEEGERAVGIINSEYDTTEGSSPEKQSRNKMSRGIVKIVKKREVDPETNQEIEYSDYEITCPYTGSSEVYHITSNVFASYETDQPFIVDINPMSDEED